MDRTKEEMADYRRKWREKKLKENPNFFSRYRKNKGKIKEISKKYYLKNIQNITAKKQSRRDALNKVKLTYGCCNPNCCWVGPIDSCALDFHHLDASSKSRCVTFFTTASMSKMIEEVKKCTVLCAICHRLERFGVIDANFERCNVNEKCEVIRDNNGQ